MLSLKDLGQICSVPLLRFLCLLAFLDLRPHDSSWPPPRHGAFPSVSVSSFIRSPVLMD